GRKPARRDRRAAPARAPRLVPRRRRARGVGAGGGGPARARHHELRALEARPAAPDARAAAVLRWSSSTSTATSTSHRPSGRTTSRAKNGPADPRRLLPVAILPLQSASFAVAEAERVARRGCKAAFIRPSFLQGRFPSHPPYQPVWKALEQLELAACIHPSAGSTNPEWSAT